MKMKQKKCNCLGKHQQPLNWGFFSTINKKYHSTMNTLEKMKRISVLQTQAENAQKNLEEINDLSQDHFLKFAEPSELEELRSKIKARYEGCLKQIMDEAKALMGDDKTANTDEKPKPSSNFKASLGTHPTITNVGRNGIGDKSYYIPIELAARFDRMMEHFDFIKKEIPILEEITEDRFNEIWAKYEFV